MATKRICSIPECGKPHYAKGWCNIHWRRWKQYGDPKGGRPAYATGRGEPAAYIFEVLKCQSNDCLTWPYSRSSNGWGNLTWNGKMKNAARLVCELAHGAPPSPKYHAAHSCGKGHEGCVNPNHLLWKTAIENAADKVDHGTYYKRTKLTEEIVVELRNSRESTMDAAERLGVSIATIRGTRSGRHWKHVPMPTTRLRVIKRRKK